MTTAVYARVSTDDKGQDPLNQIQAMPAHALEFVDYASGKFGGRAQFQAMLAAAERHKFDELVFWSFDRLTREGVLETLQYLRQLETWGIRWRSHTEPFLDSAGPMKDLMIAMLATAAKMERERLSARTKAGMTRLRTTGTASGRPVGRARLGRESECKALRGQGLSYKAIARKLGVSTAYAFKSAKF